MIGVQIHMFPKEIGIGVNEQGNVEIVGMDRDTGSLVKLEIGSREWKAFYSAAGRLSGVGIYKANRKLEVVEDMPNALKNGDEE